jgi:hypothetical protein
VNGRIHGRRRHNRWERTLVYHDETPPMVDQWAGEFNLAVY